MTRIAAAVLFASSAALAAASAFHVDPEQGNNSFNAVFDAPLGERISAISSSVGCELQIDESGAITGNCVVPLTSIMVDNEPTKSEHFHDWATNKKSPAKQCRGFQSAAG